ncbi:hypothetical protein GA0061103_2319 [Rhizobium multihospitium]|uniref:SGNH hydrolase-type esterase domain-containing protein n=2 Tax=Rhizobium multihospitium TaxID=410764 RepID=A0A1C3UJH2_9HYPH|nr:hypothetical protein GA0061103_2319 [Rhizobium multihospitium]
MPMDKLPIDNLQDRIDADIRERIKEHQKTIARISAGRQAAARLSAKAIAPPFVMMSAGDSWFDYPLLNNGPAFQQTDVIFQLQTYGTHPITVLNLAHWGDASTDMMSGPKQERMIAQLRDGANWIGGKPHGILVSAGGNDVVGRFGMFLEFNNGKNSGLNNDRFAKALGIVKESYLSLFELRDRYAPGVPIFGHDYDFPIPSYVHPLCAGPWLKPALDLNNWSQIDGERIAKDALQRFRKMLLSLEAVEGNNYHLINTQGTLTRDEWANELHPVYLGFRKVTKIFYQKLKSYADSGSKLADRHIGNFRKEFKPYDVVIAEEAASVEGASPSNDKVHIPELIENGKSPQGLAKAWKTASKALPEFPHNGCAAHLSALLQESGIDIPMTVGAGNLARLLEKRGWQRIEVRSQQAGDVGVTYDLDPDPPGPDHVYLVVERLDDDDMLIADNQRHSDEPHHRSAAGKHGKTPTEFFLRAT